MSKEKLVPEIRFRYFKNFWNNDSLINLLEFSNGVNAPKDSYGSGRKMISVLDILNPTPITYENIISSVNITKELEDSKRVNKGDLVFVRSSEIVDEVGWAKAYLDDKYALFSGFSIRGKKKHEYNAYFLELSINQTTRRQIESKSGGSTRFNVSQTILSELKVNLPTLKEQEKIGALFEKIDKAIELQEKLVEENRNFKKSMLQKMFPKKGKDIPEIRLEKYSEKWISYKLYELIIKNSNKNKDSLIRNVESVSNVHGFIKQSEQFGHSVASSSLSNYYVIQPGMFAYNPSRINVGSIGYKDLDGELSVVSPLYISFKNSKKLDDYFLWYWLKSDEFARERLRKTEGSVRSTLSYESFSNIKIKIPPLLEQKAIGLFFKSLDKKIELEEKKLENYKTLKKALLQKMFI